MLYRPLIFSLIYLILTFLYFNFGFVVYDIDNVLLMSVFFIFYIFSSIVGYFIGLLFAFKFKTFKSLKLIKISFYPFAFLTILSNIFFNSVASADGLIPYNVFNFIGYLINMDFIGIANLYYMNKSYSGEKSLVFSILFSFFGWFRFIFIPYFIYNWISFNRTKKLFGFLILFMPILTGLSLGLNKPLFDVVLLVFFSTLSTYYIKKMQGDSSFVIYKKFIKYSIFFLFVAVLSFGSAMINRGVTFDYIESNSPNGKITVSEVIPENGLTVSLTMLGHYIVQGYYGFSLSLQEDFDSTFGFGHSPFLLRQYERFTGVHINDFTYQSKINNRWADGTRWHSAFSQFANDFHFVGVSLVMFIIFFFMAIHWFFSLRYNYFEFIYIMPLHFILILFLPANNQIFGFADTLTLSVLFFLLTFFRFLYKTK